MLNLLRQGAMTWIDYGADQFPGMAGKRRIGQRILTLEIGAFYDESVKVGPELNRTVEKTMVN